MILNPHTTGTPRTLSRGLNYLMFKVKEVVGTERLEIDSSFFNLLIIPHSWAIYPLYYTKIQDLSRSLVSLKIIGFQNPHTTDTPKRMFL